MSAGQQFSIGQIDCRLIADGWFSAPPSIPFANAPQEELSTALEGMLDTNGMLAVPCNCLLIRAGGELALVDTGLGELASLTGSPAGRLLESLTAVGLRPREIEHVVVSHGHPDHIAGLTSAGEPVFGSARHYMSKAEWSFWTSEESLSRLPPQMAEPARTHLPPLRDHGLLELVEGELELTRGVRLLPAPGHTPGHLAVEIAAGEQRSIYLADAVLHELGFEYPGWIGAMDVAPELAVETRMRLLERAARARAVVAGYHLRAAGRIERLDGRYRFEALG